MLDQQKQFEITREDFFVPTNANGGRAIFESRKGLSRDLPESLRGYYQNLRFGKEGCGELFELTNKKNSYMELWSVIPSPKKIQSTLKNNL